ncbi:MAG: ABC transporter ATP-binding protein [Pseudomonadota bacterium]|uniref:Multidrug ABC transporter ATP-binding protein n=1 Tax=Alteromonas alba TaxID=2079529 RepID=A0A2S9V7L6_9ALTE|nr:ABC transporter ATP-binding protein [Alteromonas alba]MDY6925627.1 ABC transporter ATP-binding protein [Pseudomonadota bacterium]PRO72428.1 multidrug ABC transporter ATP-binding protein [Alteromonas alba]
MISVKNLSKFYDHFKAVDNLSFDISPGNIVGFLGPNGAGKSTTMKMLTGFLPPSEGEIFIKERSIDSDAKAIQRDIGYLPEGAPAYGDMTVWQFLHFIADVRRLKGSHRKERLYDVIHRVELGDVLNRPIDNLSKGFKRRVGLAQAILHDPDILILDEPTDGLDPNQKHHVRQLIEDLSREKIVIISTHILEEVAAVCNRVMIIADGQLRFDDTPEVLRHRSRYCNAVSLRLSYAADISGLAELEGVDEMEIDRKTGVVTLFPEPGKHIFHAINEYVTQRRLPVDTLTLETGRLDEVFRDITTAEVANG